MRSYGYGPTSIWGLPLAYESGYRGGADRKAIFVFGYEHSPALIDITTAIVSLEAIAEQVVGIELGEMQWAKFGPLIHPVHQQGKVFGWQVVGLIASPVRDTGEQSHG